MYYIIDPDMTAIEKGVKTEDAVYINYNFKGYENDTRERGGYGAAARATSAQSLLPAAPGAVSCRRSPLK